MELDGIQFESGNVRPKLSGKQKLINHIDREIQLIDERKDLTLKKVEKNIKGKNQIVNENRFFKNSNNENKVLVTIKYKGKMLTNKLVVEVNKNKKDIIDCLNKFKNFVSQLDVKSEFFNQIK